MAPPPLGSRQSNRSLVFGLGASITDADAIITGAKLPSGRQILRCMMYNCDTQLHAKRPDLTGALSRFQAAKAVLEQVRPFYGKANIPMVSDRRACDKMVALLDASNKLRHIPKARRSSEATARLVDAMEHKLDATFPLWSPNAEELIRDPEDIAFLASMKGDRVATFGAFDAKLQSKLKRRQEREAAQQAYLTKEQQEMTATSSMAVLESESDEDSNADETAAPPAENTPTREPSRSLMSSSEEVVGAMPERSMAREMGVAAEPGRDLIGLSSDPLSIERVYSSAVSPSCGAVALFVGTTREHFEGRRVIRLEYEAYEAMVQSELSAVCRDIRARWPMVKHICIQHRLGLVPVAEASVAIAISTPHRSEAQEAVGYCINALKASAPIWKKEVYESEDPEWKENPECGWSKKGRRGRSGNELEAP